MNSIHQQCIAQGTGNRIAPLGRALNQTCASLMTAVMQQSRPALAAVLILSMVMSTSADAIAQEAPPPPSPTAAAPMQAADLDQLVAPIALYPDALVAQILAASTYGPQVVEADAFLRQHPGMPPQELASIVDTKLWDPSVKALTAFPSVLSNLTTNFSWTTNLGEAYYNQPQSVVGAIQAMRQRAYAAGTLRSTSQETVVYQPSDITIMPASPAVVYVPVYNPWVVYGAPVPVYAPYVAPAATPGVAVAIGFTAGVLVGAFASYGWGCTHWHTNWYSHTVVYNHTTYVSHGYYGGYHGGAHYLDHHLDRNNEYQGLVQLYKALGGGWE